MKKLIFAVVISFTTLFLLSSCNPKEGELFHGALGLNDARVVIASSVAGSQIITMYDSNGNFIEKLYDYTSVAGTPRGLVKHSAISFLAAIDGINQLDILGIDKSRSLWSSNAQVTGNFYDMETDGSNFYLIETNTIEKYDSLGNRLPPTVATPYINTTLGGCTLSTPTSMVINSAGQLVVANNSTSTLSVYSLGATATCSTQTAFGNNPRALLSHSNGSLYVITQANTQETLWRANATGGSPTSLFANNTSILQDGFAMAELPSGNILISSAGTDAIVEFTQDGDFVRTFAKDGNTNDVYDIIVLGGK